MEEQSVFDKNISISGKDKVDIPYTQILGFLHINRIKVVNANFLISVDDSIQIDDVQKLSLLKLKSASYLKIRNVKNIILPELVTCPVIFLENVDTVILPKLETSIISAVNVKKLTTDATGELFCEDSCGINCPNMNITYGYILIHNSVIYEILETEILDSNTTAVYATNKQLNKSIVNLIYKCDNTYINVFGEDLKSAQESLTSRLEELN